MLQLSADIALDTDEKPMSDWKEFIENGTPVDMMDNMQRLAHTSMLSSFWEYILVNELVI